MYKLGKRSNKRLEDLHPDLAKVVRRAIEITQIDFTVLETLRTEERQANLVEIGASKTMKSKHLKQKSGYAEAVDLGAWVDGQVDWSWPLYDKIAIAMKTAAEELGVDIIWGGDWVTFKDGPHYQLA